MAGSAAKAMLAISGCCLPNPDMAGPRVSCRPRQGFTLLELLVVLVLLGLLVGLTAPAMLRAANAARLRGVRVDLINMIEALPLRAFAAGQRLTVTAEELQTQLPDWPADWQLRSDHPLRYSAAGVADGAVLVLRQGSEFTAATLRLTVAPVTGDVREE